MNINHVGEPHAVAVRLGDNAKNGARGTNAPSFIGNRRAWKGYPNPAPHLIPTLPATPLAGDPRHRWAAVLQKVKNEM